MAMYDWKCLKCQAVASTLRSVEEYDVPPVTGEDTPVSNCAHEWKKQILSAPSKKYGPGWNTRKGFH